MVQYDTEFNHWAMSKYTSERDCKSLYNRVCELQSAPRSICWATHWSENRRCLRHRPETGVRARLVQGLSSSIRIAKMCQAMGYRLASLKKHISVAMILAEHLLFVKGIGNKLECYFRRWWTKGRGRRKDSGRWAVRPSDGKWKGTKRAGQAWCPTLGSRNGG